MSLSFFLAVAIRLVHSNFPNLEQAFVRSLIEKDTPHSNSCLPLHDLALQAERTLPGLGDCQTADPCKYS